MHPFDHQKLPEYYKRWGNSSYSSNDFLNDFLLQSSFFSLNDFTFVLPFFTVQVRYHQLSSFFMSFLREGSARSSDGKFLSSEVRLIGESSNDDPTHLHNNFDTTSDQVSSVHAGDVSLVVAWLTLTWVLSLMWVVPPLRKGFAFTLACILLLWRMISNPLSQILLKIS